MIQDLVATFSSRKVFNEKKDIINPESFNIILEQGYEKMIMRDIDLYFVPGNGVSGQVLRKGDGYVYWDDLNRIRNHNNVNNLSPTYSTYIIKVGATSNTTTELKFVGDLVKGQELNLYITKDPEQAYGITVSLDKDKYVSLSGKYLFPVTSDNDWVRMRFISDGNTVYCDASEFGTAETPFFIKGVSDNTEVGNALMANNGTTKAINQYEAAFGKYNMSTRETGLQFGAKNTIFSVGNGLNEDKRHNVIRCLQNGNIEISDTNSAGEYYEKEYVVLQDRIVPKPEKAGQVLTSSTDDKFTWADPSTKFWVGSQEDYDQLQDKDKNTFYFIQED